MRMVLQHLLEIRITDILCAQAMHDTFGGKTGNGAGKFIRVFGQCSVSMVMGLKSESLLRYKISAKYITQRYPIVKSGFRMPLRKGAVAPKN
jgi:hypothetical protein